MIIDVHGHYTTTPPGLREYRRALLADPANARPGGDLGISDDQVRESLERAQLKDQRERGIDRALFSPSAGGMAHHEGTEQVSRYWAQACNGMIHRAVTLYPESFTGVCQLPQFPGVAPANCIEELERCVNELGFIGCNINPDPSDGYWTDPPLTDRWWYPLYEKLVELDVPAMVHVSTSCNPNFNGIGAHYLNGDTTAFMQLLESKLFEDFPTLRFIIPHGGGAVPYHWGRYRGIAERAGLRPPEQLMQNVSFDGCVYNVPGLELLIRTVGAGHVMFATEMYGTGQAIDPRTGRPFDDTSSYLKAIDLSEADRRKIEHENALRVYPRLAKVVG
ncbi:MAG: amidohydrolase family protein [Dehalococcoidia bacterium]|nr:amidohydrolase family protein [Dehalococcoidia bacterium]